MPTTLALWHAEHVNFASCSTSGNDDFALARAVVADSRSDERVDLLGRGFPHLDAIADRHATAIVRAEVEPGGRGFRGIDPVHAVEMADVVLRNGLWPANDFLP